MKTPNEERLSWKRVFLSSALGAAALGMVLVAAMPDDDTLSEARVQKVLRLYGEGNLLEARYASEDALEASPADPRVWMARGLLAEHDRDLKTAREAYTRACALMGADSSGRFEVAVTLCDITRREGDPSRALRELDGLLKGASQARIPGRWRHAKALTLVELGRFEEALSEVRYLAEEEGGREVARGLEAQIRKESAKATERNGNKSVAGPDAGAAPK